MTDTTRHYDLAFPVPESDAPNNSAQWGLTKREYFAAIAMQGMVSRYGGSNSRDLFVAEDAVKQADALIAALNRPEAISVHANLIAAAPKMLEALQYIANDGLAGKTASAKLEDAMTLARAAIEKATGVHA